MAIGTRSYARGYLSSGGLPPGIRGLLIANVGIFLVQFFTRGTEVADALHYFALVPAAVVKLLFVWQLATYMFLHGGIGHILFNMLALWMFGSEFERMWGTRRFLQFYFVCGTGAGLCVVVANYLFGNPLGATIGSSGAIYGLLLASAVLWPDREILFYFLIPIKMKYFVMIMGGIAFLNSFKQASPVSDIAHLGGMAFAYGVLKLPRVRGIDPLSSLKAQYHTWRIRRARKKFEVYVKKHNSDQDRFVN